MKKQFKALLEILTRIQYMCRWEGAGFIKEVSTCNVLKF